MCSHDCLRFRIQINETSPLDTENVSPESQCTQRGSQKLICVALHAMQHCDLLRLHSRKVINSHSPKIKTSTKCCGNSLEFFCATSRFDLKFVDCMLAAVSGTHK